MLNWNNFCALKNNGKICRQAIEKYFAPYLWHKNHFIINQQRNILLCLKTLITRHVLHFWGFFGEIGQNFTSDYPIIILCLVGTSF